MRKLRKYLPLLLCLAALCAALALVVSAATETGSCGANLTYTLDTETGVLTVSGTGRMSAQIRVTDEGTVRSLAIEEGVTYISMSAFSNYKNLETVTLPSTVTSVGRYAFSGCESLRAVYIRDLAAFSEIWFEEKVSNPLYYAHHLYLNGALLTRLDLPESTRQIGTYAFCGGTDFTAVTIPASVKRISHGAFSGCEKLGSIRVDRKNADYICEGNVLMSSDRKTVICAVPAGFSGTFTVPDATLSICTDAFLGCRGLTGVIPSETTRYIGKNAFADTAWLDAQLDGVVYLGNVALLYKGEMPKNTEIILRDGTVAVADSAFADAAENLKRIRIPASLENFGCGAFPGAYPSCTSPTLRPGVA